MPLPRSIGSPNLSDLDLKSFYTALYRAQLHPNVFMDVDGRYRVMVATKASVWGSQTRHPRSVRTRCGSER